MDDWYVTRALLSGSNTTLLDLGDHYCSTNSEDELDTALQRKKTRKNPQRTIFAHFRPADKLCYNKHDKWYPIKTKSV
ncbi:hypothetical protein ANCDUO_08728 [Ancylostoma duodenale]|uniref:Uncharacterized protein n=1 Tax=Ancylostoma duodenale TaxID=51022 RepID=A0A0C2DF06_9BILA|nr:hypothetical protein ANCDUO_08728 [Ancylostoma duodenale]